MHVIICGGRDYILTHQDRKWLDTLGITVAYVGGASGADSGGAAWAKSRNVTLVVTKADWAKYGKAAGPIRNHEQLIKLISGGKATEVAVVAFPGGPGTADMVARANKAGVKVIERGIECI